MARTKGVGGPKEKRSFTLSPAALSLLEDLKREHPESSTSSLLEGVLLQVRDQRQRHRLEQDVADYYNSLSDAEKNEHSDWSEFALKEAAGALES